MTDSGQLVPLSETELEVLQQIATGATNREIAHARGISEATVKKHVTNINNKLDTSNRTEAVRRALDAGIISIDTPGDEDEGNREATRALAEELQRTRRRTRLITRTLVGAGVLLLGVTLALSYVVFQGGLPGTAPATPTPAPTVDTEQWLPSTPLPGPRAGLALVEAGDAGTLLAIGGRGPDGPLSETLSFDYGRFLSWEPVADKPTAVHDITAAAVGGVIVVPGGCGDDGRATDVTEIYDPRADSWRRGPALPAPSCGYALVALEGRVLLFGGRAEEDPASARDAVWEYRLGEDAWQVRDAVLPQPRSDLTAVVVGGRVHLIGGRDETGQPQVNHWSLDPFAEPGRWELNEPALPEGRAGHVAAALLRRIYLIGGGWDRSIEPGALWLEDQPDAEWQPYEDVRGRTPQRGAALAVREGRFLVTVGGQADDQLLDQHQLVQVVFRAILPGGVR